jgi:hypothetical protein
VVGCHNTHRIAALRDIGGFPAHEADDLVMTLFYRTSGWLGVYVPAILARGITPVDWRSYLTQQRRWARSVLDYKLRVFPNRSSGLPLSQRLLTHMHGLYYLRGPVMLLQLALLTMALLLHVSPSVPGYGALRALGALIVVVLLCELYRQRFFLDRDGEAGIHWRARFVSAVKWPAFVLAAWDASLGRYGTYTTTPKRARSPRALGFAAIHAGVLLVIGTVWSADLFRGASPFVPLHLATVLILATSFAAMVTVFQRFPPMWEARLRDAWNERTGVPCGPRALRPTAGDESPGRPPA